jgi:hypothetical protein
MCSARSWNGTGLRAPYEVYVSSVGRWAGTRGMHDVPALQINPCDPQKPLPSMREQLVTSGNVRS